MSLCRAVFTILLPGAIGALSLTLPELDEVIRPGELAPST
jgi:hypothetical protein